MKTILFLFLLFISLSCSNSPDFYIGTWELNEDNGLSSLTLSEDRKLNWDLRGTRVMEDEDFEAVQVSPQKYDIRTGLGEDCMKMTIQKLSNTQCIGCTYKCWIDENRIDEVFIMRKDNNPREPIPEPEEEVIVLPNNFEGDFFIVYDQRDANQTGKIRIDHHGVGINPGAPDLRQLFNANRIFKFEGHTKNITIANPNNYNENKNPDIDSLFRDEEVIVVQKGYNQSARNQWNEAHTQNAGNTLNIEYFEMRWLKN